MKSNLYFPELDGLRFFAFFWVFLGHLSRPKNVFSWFQKTKWMGVDVFFLLSSFLITLLLFKEFELNKKISYKNFIIRRFLRLFPLYFLIVILGAVIFPYLNYDIGPKFNDIFKWTPIYLLMIANIIPPPVVGNVLGPLWSIMVEFQFYLLIVPLIVFLINKGKEKYLIHFSIILISISIVFHNLTDNPQTVYLNLLGRLYPFAMGIILGYLYFSKKIKIHGFSLFISALALFYIGSKLGRYTISSYLSVALASFLLIYSTLTSSVIKGFFGSSIFRQLGKVSFGLYVFHTLGIHLAVPISIPFLNEFYSRMLIAFFFTVGISALSFYTLENYFLSLKTKFTTIHHANSKENSSN